METIMNEPLTIDPRPTAPDTTSLTTWLPIPGYGVLPVNSFVIRAAQPVLVDTGIAAFREDYLRNLRATIDPADLRWIWITHTDADHVGNLREVLAEAPQARVVTTFIGMAKMNLLGFPVDRVYLLNPGQTLDVGDRQLFAFAPPVFDAPETTGLYDTRTGTVFTADSFGALLNAPAENAEDISSGELADGLNFWATLDAPWLHTTDPSLLERRVDVVRRLDPKVLLSSHLPPARGLRDRLFADLPRAREATPFVGPDQAALEKLFAA
jgi:flavorubredoxin